ncbi:MAG: hypothetical protein A6F71_04785 [Cycloclasticus sp. symbiont of Poecilosclerida sp. M]|nr:MAG: hypothetical protein A6F71_04785 [Cycloclasticus sp. symbiont of Poecilosclerida sp. M]
MLVVDDGSTDDSANIVRGILSKQKGFRFVQHKNSGPAATRNRGIDKTQGRYLIFLDADDEMMPQALEHYRCALDSNEIIGMLAGGHISKTPLGDKKESTMPAIPKSAEARLKAYLLDKSLALSNGAVAISREVFDAYRYPEQFRASEGISMFAFILANFEVLRIKEPLAVIYKHNDSLRHNVTDASAAGLLVVDEVFGLARIPAQFQHLKIKFMAQRSLSLFRTLFIAGNVKEARTFYHRAVRFNPLVIFRASYFIQYLRSWF